MNSFLTEWGKDLKSIPVGPLGVIAMAGCEEMGKKVNGWLQKWSKQIVIKLGFYFIMCHFDFSFHL